VHTHRVDKSGLRPPQLKQFSDSQKLLKLSEFQTRAKLKKPGSIEDVLVLGVDSSDLQALKSVLHLLEWSE
jgi:hypothetical protein